MDRSTGTKLGACKLASDTRVSTYFHHGGEELVYRGLRGSGTIFFTSCNMSCAYCQNGDISTDKDNGMVVDARTLATMAWLLRMEGCHNVNWVGGEVTIHLHTILEAIALLGGEFARPMPDALVNIMDQYHPDNFCDPCNPKYQYRYENLARCPTVDEVRKGLRYAHQLGLHFETITYEKIRMGLGTPDVA